MEPLSPFIDTVLIARFFSLRSPPMDFKRRRSFVQLQHLRGKHQGSSENNRLDSAGHILCVQLGTAFGKFTKRH